MYSAIAKNKRNTVFIILIFLLLMIPFALTYAFGWSENMMQSALKSIFAVAEAYPQLQANQNFLQLQGELVDTEDKIQASRRFYNGGVRELNTKIKVFPNTLFVRGLGFHERDFFEVTEPAAIAEPPRVQF